jgi:O-acetyl-ADP-ribose deacetylase (regulator of RNase III)
MKFIKQGDIFESSCEVIANPINCVGVMGGGLALAFKKKYPEHFETYKKMCQNGEIKVGELYVIDGDEKHKVLLFPTKIHWKNPSLMEYVESGLEYLAIS